MCLCDVERYNTVSTMAAFTSFYCANVIGLSAQSIKDIFDEQQVGLVHRVDFFRQFGRPYYSAMIHLDHWYESDKAYEVYNNILDGSGWAQVGFMRRDSSQRRCFILLKQMRGRRIADTYENTRQFAVDLTNQQKAFNSLKEDVARIQETIYQMLGSIYCQRTDSASIFRLNNFMLHDSLYDRDFLTHDGKIPERMELDEDGEDDTRTIWGEIDRLSQHIL